MRCKLLPMVVFDDDLLAVKDLGGDHVRVIGALPTGEIVVDLPGAPS